MRVSRALARVPGTQTHPCKPFTGEGYGGDARKRGYANLCARIRLANTPSALSLTARGGFAPPRAFRGSAYRLGDGNTLINFGAARAEAVNPPPARPSPLTLWNSPETPPARRRAFPLS